jgi:tRNA(Arg) A34 adenosine deaminase TadA
VLPRASVVLDPGMTNMARDPVGTEASLDTLFTRAVVHRRNFLAAGAASVAVTAAAGGSTATAAPQVVQTVPTEEDRRAMGQAIALMRKAGVTDKTGGPFGAVIMRDGEILAASGNSVLKDSDPSAHAEVNAIRIACKKVGAPNLKGATLYTSCEPCPMCYATAYWARIDKIHFAAAWTDYADLFDDQNINEDTKKPYAARMVPISQMMQPDAQKVWSEYRALPSKTRY